MNRFNLRFLLVSLVSILASLEMSTNIASAQTSPARTETMNGFLNCKDGACVFGLHYVDLVRGRTYAICVESTEIQPRLFLESLDGSGLAADTDYADLNGCIVFHAPATGRYRLIANSFAPVGGAYVITMRELPVVLSVEGVLANGRARGHDLALEAGRRYVIDLESRDFSAFVRLLNSDDVIVAFEDECLGDMARLVFVPRRSGIYRVMINAAGPSVNGDFAIRVCED